MPLGREGREILEEAGVEINFGSLPCDGIHISVDAQALMGFQSTVIEQDGE